MRQILFLSIALLALNSEARTSLFRAPEPTPIPLEKASTAAFESSISKVPNTLARRPATERRSRNWSMVAKGSPIIGNSDAVKFLNDIKVGELLSARIPTSVIAFSEGKAPVLAELKTKSGLKYLLMGDATLEKTSKRITVEFTKIRRRESVEVFNFKAQALDSDGTLGLKGILKSGEAKYFAAELLSAAAAGFADSTVNRSTNSIGNSVEEPSLDTQTKKALSSAMVKSAECNRILSTRRSGRDSDAHPGSTDYAPLKQRAEHSHARLLRWFQSVGRKGSQGFRDYKFSRYP